MSPVAHLSGGLGLRRFAVGQVTQSLVGHAYSKNSKKAMHIVRIVKIGQFLG